MKGFKFKILLMGNGKIDFIRRLMDDKFYKDHKLHIGLNIFIKNVEFDHGEIATLTIWDIDERERFKFIRNVFYRGAAGILLVVDLSENQSFEKIKKWLNEIRLSIGRIPFLLIGKKNENYDESAENYRNRARIFAEHHGNVYIDALPKKMKEINEAFAKFTRHIIESRFPKQNFQLVSPS